MKIECHSVLPDNLKTEWKEFHANAAHQHPRQDLRFGPVEVANGCDILHVIGREDREIKAIGLFTMRRHPFLPKVHAEAQCLSGPVCDDPDTLVQFVEAAHSHRAFSRTGRISVTPYWLNEEAEKLDVNLVQRGWIVSASELTRSTGLVDITPERDEILARFSKSARREARRALRQGIVVREIVDEEEAFEFLDSLNRLRSERGLPVIGSSAFETTFRTIHGPGELGRIFGAYGDGTFVGGLMVYRSRFVVHGRHFTTEPATLKKISNLRIAPIVWLEAMVWARNLGCHSLDVEGYIEPSQYDGDKHKIYKYKSELYPTPTLRIAEHYKTANTLINLGSNPKSILKNQVRKFLRKVRT